MSLKEGCLFVDKHKVTIIDIDIQLHPDNSNCQGNCNYFELSGFRVIEVSKRKRPKNT